MTFNVTLDLIPNSETTPYCEVVSDFRMVLIETSMLCSMQLAS